MSTLQERVVEFICLRIDLYVPYILLLPSSLRDLILQQLSRWGLLDDSLLTSLISPEPLTLVEPSASSGSGEVETTESSSLSSPIVDTGDDHDTATSSSSSSSSASVQPPFSPPLLSSLVLNHNARLTDFGLSSVLRYSFLSLRQISLSACPLISDPGVRQLSKCPNLRSLNLSECYQITDQAFQFPETGESVFRAWPQLQILDLSGCTQLTDSVLSQLGVLCPLLSELSLSNCLSISFHGFFSLFSTSSGSTSFLNLLSLDLSSCSKVNSEVGLKIAEHCTTLTKLNIARCFLIDDPTLVYIVKHCTNIRSLWLRGCNALTDDGIGQVFRYCPRLRDFDIGWCNVNGTCLQGIETLDCRQTIERISFTWCLQLSDSSIANFVKHCTNLLSLDVSWRSESLSAGSVIESITSYLPGLTSLDMASFSVNDVSHLYLLSRLTNLQVLNLSWQDKMDNQVLSNLGNCTNLRSLDLSLADISDGLCDLISKCSNLKALMLSRCFQIPGTFLHTLSSSKGQLLSLSINDLCRITDSQFSAFFASPAPRRLQSLAINSLRSIPKSSLRMIGPSCRYLQSLFATATNLDDEALISIAENCSALTILIISSCHEVSSRGIKALSKHCLNLVQLAVNSLNRIDNDGFSSLSSLRALNCFSAAQSGSLTDEGLISIVQSCRLLQSLNVSGNWQLSDKFLNCVWIFCPHLSDLNIEQCNVSQEALSSCRRLCPKLKIKSDIDE